MRLIPLVQSTIRASKRDITVYLINSALLILVYNLYMDRVILLYPLLLSGAVLFVYLLMKGLALAGFYQRLENAPVSVEDDTGDTCQARVFETIAGIHQKYLNQITRQQAQMNTRNTLFTQFIHSMKSSVSVIELACEKYSGSPLPDTSLPDAPLPDILPPDTPLPDILHDISIENEKLKKNLEQALNLLRLDIFANDYVPERLDLSALTAHTINEHKRDFIYAGVYPQLEGSAHVYTDAKWCGFIIGQLLTNAVKYSSPGDRVLFHIAAFPDRTELRVTDSGMGIPPEDLPRVFDMFFTGANGRQRQDATGIGLFMAKHVADRLGIALRIDSERGRGTTVVLTFLY
jgi:signal transduction histidine kinase